MIPENRDGNEKASSCEREARAIERVRWRMGLVAGYCPSTNQPHSSQDFERRGGIYRIPSVGNRYKCSDCGLSVDEESYHRLSELVELKRSLPDRRGIEIRVEE